MEREAIVSKFVEVPGLPFRRYKKLLDLSAVEVGDHFLASGRVNMGWVKRQLTAGVGGSMRFRCERVTPHLEKYVRTA